MQGLTNTILTFLSGGAGLLVLYLVLTNANGLTFKKLVGAVALAFATVVIVAASPQIGAAAYDYGRTDFVGDVKTTFADTGTAAGSTEG